MAKCKLCKKTIDDAAEYCAGCADKKDLAANESYLDSLLNSVQETATTANDIYKKKKDTGRNSLESISEPSESEAVFSLDLDDLQDFDQYDIMNELDEPIVISDEELFGDIISLQPNGNEISEYSEDAKETVSDEKMISADTPEIEQEDKPWSEENVDKEFLGTDDSETDNDDEEYPDLSLDDLMKQMDILSDDEDSGGGNADTHNIADTEDEPSQKKVEPEEELLNLLNQIDPDKPIEEDLLAISSLLEGMDNNQRDKEFPEDVGEVFSEALEAVSTLTDPAEETIQIPEESEDSKEKDSNKKTAKRKKDTEKAKEKKAGLFTRLFSNIEDEEPLKSEKRKAEEETAALKETGKKKKKAKGKAHQTEGQEDAEETEESAKSKKAQKKEEKQKKKIAKREKKKIEIIDDEIDEGRINKVGASIVLMFFGMLVMLLLISTNIFSYSLSIKNATDYFGRHRYTQAYNEVYGIDIKDEDIELYDKIMTVMYVNKQLNSYNNYYHMEKYPEALDSLLKGLQRYDKYIELATILGIKTDLDYVRNQIIAELYNVFSLTEEQAVKIINSENQAAYSIAVYDVVLENLLFNE